MTATTETVTANVIESAIVATAIEIVIGNVKEIAEIETVATATVIDRDHVTDSVNDRGLEIAALDNVQQNIDDYYCVLTNE